MLFNLVDDNLEKMPFVGMIEQKRLEKDLENIMVKNLEKLFENTPLFTIFQERSYQEEADIYALNKNGDLVILELKRSKAKAGSINQLFRYVSNASEWTYYKLEKMYHQFSPESKNKSLAKLHQKNFNLEEPLEEDYFNSKQHMWVIGNAANNELIKKINFWKNNGLSIDFYPYRIYEINGEEYFEFFAKPYDIHVNPAKTKGVLFDTNRSYDEESFEHMIKNKRVSAYGDRKNAVESFNKNDLVFYSHKGYGIVGAGKIKSNKIKKTTYKSNEEWYCDVELLTPEPDDFNNPKAMSFKECKRITDQSYFWARIQKVPYLTFEEAKYFKKELKNYLEESN